MKIVPSVETLNRRLKACPSHRVVFTNGVFDLLHQGHVELLQFARDQGDCLVVGINTDDSVRRLKGPRRPLVCLEERMEVLAALEAVDYVCAIGEDTPGELIRRLCRVDVLVKGGDYTPDQIVGRDTVEKAGGRVRVFPFRSDVSTTRLIEKIRRHR